MSARILIADDAPFFRLMLKDLLEKAGHTVLLAEDGEQAVSLAQKEGKTLDLLILDMVLPKKTGFEVLMDLSDSPFKILCVTGNEEVHELEELRDLGAAQIVTKSSPIETILYHINQLIYKKDGPPRTQPRSLVSTQIRYQAQDQAFVSHTFTLSAQGLYIKADHLFPAGTELSIAFFVPTDEQNGKEVECKGKVVRVEEGKDPGTIRGMGILFTEITPFDRQIVADFVTQNAK